ncbi:MAG TPA: beta-galactosidase [Tepidisphaeraceae bacterium]|nr:beta-galactosidase [Tepidisphaeraceae bacterium]
MSRLPLLALLLVVLPAVAQPVAPTRKVEHPAAPDRKVEGATPRRPEVQPSKPVFMIGVFQQPIDSMAAWKGRGVNTMVSYESQGGRVSNKAWSDAVAGHGLYFVRQPSDDLEADGKEPYLLALMHDDEPDIRKPPTSPPMLAKLYAEWKQAAPDKPVFLNLSGGQLLGGRTPRAVYDEYVKSADWISSDIYPVTGYNRPDWLWKVGASVDALREWSGGKPQFACIETSAQELAWTAPQTRGVTPDEFRAEVWNAVIHGARGITYFPQRLGRNPSKQFKYDATPANVALEMATQNARLTELAAALVSPMNPSTHAARSDKPMDVGWRVHDGKLYVLALNFSDGPVKAVKITLAGTTATGAQVLGEKRDVRIDGGAITDDFGPYAVHVYRVGTEPAAR